MPIHPVLRRWSALASALAAAGLMLTVAGCSGHITPIGPDASSPPPKPRHLASPIILQPMHSRPFTSAGKCPAGYVELSAPSPGTCYRSFGTPATITSAAISPVSTTGPSSQKGSASYGFTVAVPASEQAAATAVIKQAYDAKGALAVNVAGKTWSAPQVLAPFPGQQFEISLPSRKQALELYRILVPAA